jgi:phosphoribosyl-AMP cyclohydrolase
MHSKLLEESSLLNLQFEKRGGLLPVIVQETLTGQILMMAYVDKVAVDFSLEHKIAAFYSTSRQKLWIKGEESGNFLLIDEILTDCDQDSLLYKVTLSKGGVCHTYNLQNENRKSCFYRQINMKTLTLEFIEK